MIEGSSGESRPISAEGKVEQEIALEQVNLNDLFEQLKVHDARFHTNYNFPKITDEEINRIKKEEFEQIVAPHTIQLRSIGLKLDFSAYSYLPQRWKGDYHNPENHEMISGGFRTETTSLEIKDAEKFLQYLDFLLQNPVDENKFKVIQRLLEGLDRQLGSLGKKEQNYEEKTELYDSISKILEKIYALSETNANKFDLEGRYSKGFDYNKFIDIYRDLAVYLPPKEYLKLPKYLQKVRPLNELNDD